MKIAPFIKHKAYNFAHPQLGKILMLHRVVSQRSRLSENRKIEVTPDFLEQTLLKYKNEGYRFVDLDEVARVVKGEKQNQKFVCFTFDDGYADNYYNAFPIFKKHNCPFTINITTDFYEHQALLWWYILEDLDVSDEEFSALREKILKLKYCEIKLFFKEKFYGSKYSFEEKVKELSLSAEQIKDLSSSGLCTIGNHTVSHPNLRTLYYREQEQQIVEAKQKLEALTCKPIRHFAYPYGLYTNDTLHILQKASIITALKTWGGGVREGDNPQLLNRIELREE